MRTFTLSSSRQAAFQLDLERDLNDAQRAAVTCGDGPKLVIAGAGSGKTRTITYRVAHLLTRGILPPQILLATFTNKASREMLSRVEALTGSDAASIWGGTSMPLDASEGTSSVKCFFMIAGIELPLKGTSPQSIWNSITPRL